MTAAEFLQQLENYLHTLTKEERENALSYYREYLEEAGEDAASAIEALGSPQSVAERIIAEAGESGYAYTSPEYSPSSGTDGGRIALTITFIIITFPIWFTVFCLWASLIFSMAVILLAFVFSAVAAPIQGALFIRDGMLGMGLWDIGSGILCIGLALLLWQPFLKATVASSKGLFRLSKNMLRNLLGKERTV